MISLALRGLQRTACTSSGLIKVLTAPQQSLLKSLQCSIPARSQCLVFSRNAHAAAATQTVAHGKGKHDHVGHWQIERVLDVIMLPLIPLAFITDNVYANYALIICVGAHVHWGMESIVMDYLRPRVVGNAAHYAGLGFIYLLSFATLAGLIYLNYSQMPPTKAIKKLWAV